MKAKEVKIKSSIIILFLFSFCHYVQAQELDTYQFFPANVGDRWEYTQAGPNVIYTIIRDSIDANDSSRLITYDAFTSYNQEPTQYSRYRIDKNDNVFYDPLLDNWHLYKLDAQIGDSWTVRKEDHKAAKVLDISEAYIFGKQTIVKTIGFYLLTRDDTVITENSVLQYWEKLAYGFGLISSEDGATEPMLLRGCRINGITYGTVDVKEIQAVIPSEFILKQNFPNPFNPTTFIRYQLPTTGHVVLKIYDSIGEEIATLVDEEKQAGRYEIKFDGQGLASGVYFYQLIANNTCKTMKMVLQK